MHSIHAMQLTGIEQDESLGFMRAHACWAMQAGQLSQELRDKRAERAVARATANAYLQVHNRIKLSLCAFQMVQTQPLSKELLPQSLIKTCMHSRLMVASQQNLSCTSSELNRLCNHKHELK